jgi:hypothetical protein
MSSRKSVSGRCCVRNVSADEVRELETSKANVVVWRIGIVNPV